MTEKNGKQSKIQSKDEDKEEEEEVTYNQQMKKLEPKKHKTPKTPKELKNKGFDLTEQIGIGTFSKVYRASWTQMPGVPMACKRIETDDVDEEWKEKCLDSELRIMQTLKNKNIIEVYTIEKALKVIFIFMQLAENGTVLEYMNRTAQAVPQERAMDWMAGLMAGLAYCHAKNIAHRDLKLANFLLNNNCEDALLSDFGFAVIDQKRKRLMRATVCGTPEYMAPEIHSAGPAAPYDAKIADLYSMGVCLFEMVNYDKPFGSDLVSNDSQLVRAKRERRYRFREDIPICDELKDLINRLLEPEPRKRISIKQILKHKVFNP